MRKEVKNSTGAISSRMGHMEREGSDPEKTDGDADRRRHMVHYIVLLTLLSVCPAGDPAGQTVPDCGPQQTKRVKERQSQVL